MNPRYTALRCGSAAAETMPRRIGINRDPAIVRCRRRRRRTAPPEPVLPFWESSLAGPDSSSKSGLEVARSGPKTN